MSIFTEIRDLLNVNGSFNQLTLAEVVDTNDPQQMGRVRAACAYLGDTENSIIEDIPWASPISPLTGTVSDAIRGRDRDATPGPVAYGMFNTPTVGSYVLLACIEGDPRFRVYLGGLHDQFLIHTLPHGRYTYKTTDELTDEPSGPLSSTEEPIQPLYDSQTAAFTKSTAQKIVDSDAPPEPRKNYEYRTRAADRSVSGLDNIHVNGGDSFYSYEPDDKAQEFTEPDGNTINNTQGYHKSRIEEDLRSSATGYAYDPQVYSWTSPGFHSVSMSDSAENCRVRIRSTHGHQIIMDDTNERVYISTATGKTWIELDEKGNIDIYGERNISVHAEKDINFTAGDTFRVKAKNGIHLVSENEVRVHAKGGKLHLKSGGTTELHSIGDMNMSVSNLFLTADTDIHIKATLGVLNLQSGNTTNILAIGPIVHTASAIYNNDIVVAAPATDSVSSNTFDAWWTSRIPEHEPWARMMTDPDVTDSNIDNTHIDAGEYISYDDALIGREERGESLGRNPNWHR